MAAEGNRSSRSAGCRKETSEREQGKYCYNAKVLQKERQGRPASQLARRPVACSTRQATRSEAKANPSSFFTALVCESF